MIRKFVVMKQKKHNFRSFSTSSVIVVRFLKQHDTAFLSAQCVHIPSRGFRRGSYHCDCPPSRLRSSTGGSARTSNSSESTADQSGLDGVDLERAYVENLLSGGVGPLVSCPTCERACMAEYDPLLRGIPLGVQSLCITVTIILTFVIVRLRKTKVCPIT